MPWDLKGFRLDDEKLKDDFPRGISLVQNVRLRGGARRYLKTIHMGSSQVVRLMEVLSTV